VEDYFIGLFDMRCPPRKCGAAFGLKRLESRAARYGRKIIFHKKAGGYLPVSFMRGEYGDKKRRLNRLNE
jgi:hypothetical protein